MKQIRAIVTILTFVSIRCSESLPVTSKALENNYDQFIWQTAWYSQRSNEETEKSPFTGDPRRITAKSIFITPNFNQNTSHCPLGYKIDNGKCIKFVNINQDDILVTRLQSYFSHHQTTDDMTNNDYDYSLEKDADANETQFTLPLVPILNDSDTNIYTSDEPPSSTEQFKFELNELPFHQPNGSENKIGALWVAEVINDTKRKDEKNTMQEHSKLNSSSEIVHLNKSSTPTVEYSFPLEYSDVTEFSDEDGSTEPNGILNEDENHPQITSSELLINRSEAEKTISSSTTTINLDDYFDTILLNESLLVDKTTSYENMVEFDYDVTTSTALITDQFIEESSGDDDVLETTTKHNIMKADVEIAKVEIIEGSGKFVYNQMPAMETLENISNAPSTAIRFPTDNIPEGQRVRFPDDSSPSSALSRDNGYHVMRFWKHQPLINDLKYFSRRNSGDLFRKKYENT